MSRGLKFDTENKKPQEEETHDTLAESSQDDVEMQVQEE